MLSGGTFSKSSLKLFTLKCLFLDSIKSTHSNKICLTVNWQSQAIHCGGSSLSKGSNEVKWVWPIRILVKTPSSRLMIREPPGQRPSWGWISCSLLFAASSHWDCHLRFKKEIDVFFKITIRNGNICDSTWKTSLWLAASAFSLPLMPTWLGIQ